MTIGSPPAKTPIEELLSTVRETLAAHFSQEMGAAAIKVSDSLDATANTTQDKAKRDDLRTASSSLATLGRPLSKALLALVRRQYDQKLNPSRFNAAGTLTLDALELVDEAQVQEDIAIGKATIRLKEQVSFEFFALSRRIAHLLGVEHIVDRDNPVFPGIFAHALRDGLRECGLGGGQRLLIFAAYDAALQASLEKSYHLANEELIARGILIEIKANFGRAILGKSITAPLATVSRTATDPPPPMPAASVAAATPPAPPAAPATPVRENSKDDDITSMLRQMLLRDDPAVGERTHLVQRLLSATGSPTETETGLKGIGMLQEDVRRQVTSALEVQAGLLRRPDTGIAEEDDGGDDPALTGLAALEAIVLAEDLTLAQRVTCCIIVGAFNRLLSAPAIGEHVGLLLLRVEASVVKAAFAEPRLLRDAAHPVRATLDRLSEFAIAQPQLLQRGHPSYASLAVVLDGVSLMPEYDRQAYAAVADNISALFANEEETAAAGDEKALMMMEIEVTENAINAATEAIEARLDRGVAVPEFVATFVRVIWKEVLFHDVLNGGVTGDLWLRDVGTLDTLLKSIRGQESAAARGDMLRRLPVLVGSLDEGAQSVRCDAAYLENFMTQLREIHSAASNAPFQRASPPLARTADSATLRLNAQLRRGQWVEFRIADGQKLRRARLNWVSPSGSNGLFKDYLQNESFTVELKALHQQLDSKDARLVGSLGLSRHAIVFAIQHLRGGD